MSLVGPRPLIPEEHAALPPWVQDTRVTCLPGITGAWQVRSDRHAAIDVLFESDASYVMRQSLSRDLVILVRTVPAVLRG
jgi:lipopolysaccharide/colanic/teichoic acid biosynthesis glycosyltransferase